MLLNLPDKDSQRIEMLVEAGEYATKSEFIRFAIKQMLYGEERLGRLEATTSKLQKQTKSRKQIRRGSGMGQSWHKKGRFRNAE